MNKFFFLIALQILLGVFFLFSAWAKLYPVEPFELTFVEIGLANWHSSPFIARTLIGVEFALGFFLIAHLFTRKTLLFTLGLLVMFTIYLGLQIHFNGNKGDCGCFGSYLPMTPLQSIYKNVILIGITLLLFINKFEYRLRYKAIPIVLFLNTAFVLPYVLNPVDLNLAAINAQDAVDYKFPSPLIYGYQNKVYPLDTGKLEQGKYLLALFSLSCSHCRIAGRKLHILHQNHPEWPMFIIFNGDEKLVPEFMEEAKTQGFQFCVFNSASGFGKMVGQRGVPALFLLQNGVVKTRMNYYTVDETAMIDFFNKK